MISYKQMSLFDAPPGSILVHAVNCQGVWGSGIAKEFKARFPNSFEAYRSICNTYNHNELIGSSFVLPNEKDYNIGCLFTSIDYGERVDPPDEIRVNTALAIHDLFESSIILQEAPKIYSNKFNSGFFKVPWEQTEYILSKMTGVELIEWVVCSV